jgi:hypothetical protein
MCRVLTRLVLDLHTVKQKICNEIHRFLRFQDEIAEFLKMTVGSIEGRCRNVDTLLSSINFQNRMTVDRLRLYNVLEITPGSLVSVT